MCALMRTHAQWQRPALVCGGAGAITSIFRGRVPTADIGLLSGSTPLVLGSLMWMAHIAADRAMGFGLKYPTTFQHTHLQHA